MTTTETVLIGAVVLLGVVVVVNMSQTQQLQRQQQASTGIDFGALSRGVGSAIDRLSHIGDSQPASPS